METKKRSIRERLSPKVHPGDWQTSKYASGAINSWLGPTLNQFADLIDLKTYRDVHHEALKERETGHAFQREEGDYELCVLDYNAPWGSANSNSQYRFGSKGSTGYSGELDPGVIPDELRGAAMILHPLTRDEDRGSFRVRHCFTLKKPAFVYILHIDGARIPPWLRSSFTRICPNYNSLPAVSGVPLHHCAGSMLPPPNSTNRWHPANVVQHFVEWVTQTQVESHYTEKGDSRFAVWRSVQPFSTGPHTLPGWEQPEIGVDVFSGDCYFENTYNIAFQSVETVEAALRKKKEEEEEDTEHTTTITEEEEEEEEEYEGDDEAIVELYDAIRVSDIDTVRELSSTISNDAINTTLTKGVGGMAKVHDTMRETKTGVVDSDIDTVMRLAVHTLWGRTGVNVQLVKLLLSSGFEPDRESVAFLINNWNAADADKEKVRDERDAAHIAAAQLAQPSWQVPPFFFDELPEVVVVVQQANTDGSSVSTQASAAKPTISQTIKGKLGDFEFEQLDGELKQALSAVGSSSVRTAVASNKMSAVGTGKHALEASKDFLFALLPTTKHPIQCALIIARAYREVAKKEPSKAAKCEAHAKTFESVAVKLVNAMHTMDNDAEAILHGKPIVANVLSGPLTDDHEECVLSLALASHNTEMMSQSVIFDYMAHRWAGSDLNHAWRKSTFVDIKWPKSFDQFVQHGWKYGLHQNFFCPRSTCCGAIVYNTLVLPFSFCWWYVVLAKFRSQVFSPAFQWAAGSVGQIMFLIVYHAAMGEASVGLGEFSAWKVTMWVLCSGFMMSEVGALSTEDGRREYFGGSAAASIWNAFDWFVFGGIMVSSMLTTAVVRWGTGGIFDASNVEVGEVGYNITAACGILLYGRVLEIVMIMDSLGPLVTIVGAMIKKLLYVAFLLVAMLLAFAQYFYHVFANKRDGIPVIDAGSALEAFGPHESESNIVAFARTCVSLFGTFIGEFALEDFFSGDTNVHNDWRYIAAFAAGVVFVLLVTILVANLLIAVVSNLYRPEATKPDYIFSIAEITMKYELMIERDALPPPFNLLQLPFSWLGVGVVKEYPDRILAFETVLQRARERLAQPANAFSTVMLQAKGHRKGKFGYRVASLEKRFARHGIEALYAEGVEERKMSQLREEVLHALKSILPKRVVEASGGAAAATLRSISATLSEHARLFDEIEVNGIDTLLKEEGDAKENIDDGEIQPQNDETQLVIVELRTEVKRELERMSPNLLTIDRWVFLSCFRFDQEF